MRNPSAITLPDTHQFVALSDGRCHFRESGSGAKGTLLLLHGATVPGWEFDRIVPLLNNAGYRTICPDLYGHGYSDRPVTRYDHALFVRQVTDLLDTLKVNEPVSVFGHSLGAAIGVRLACIEPSRVDRLVLAAPLLDFISVQPASRLLLLPLIGELLMYSYVKPMLIRRRTEKYRTIEDGHFVQMFQDQFLVPGYGRALLSLFRAGSLGDQSDCYESLQAQQHPVLILRGGEDIVFTAEHLARISALLPRAEMSVFDDMSHPMMLSHPDEVAPVIIEFLQSAGVSDRDRAVRTAGGDRSL